MITSVVLFPNFSVSLNFKKIKSGREKEVQWKVNCNLFPVSALRLRVEGELGDGKILQQRKLPQQGGKTEPGWEL